MTLIIMSLFARASTFEMPATITIEEPPPVTELTREEALFATATAIGEWQVTDSSVNLEMVLEGEADITVTWDPEFIETDDLWGVSAVYTPTENPEHIISSTIYMAADRSWKDEESLDFQSVLTHEIGHSLGFHHSEDPEATMYPSADPGETIKRDLTRAEREMVREAYPPEFPMGEALGETNGCGGFFTAMIIFPFVAAQKRRRCTGDS